MKEVCLLQFMLAKGSGDAFVNKVYKFLTNNPNTAIEELSADKEMLIKLGAKSDVADNIILAKEEAFRLYDEIYKEDIKMCWLGDKEYPEKLRDLKNAVIPPILFFKGNIKLLEEITIGFCGSRKVSESGMAITQKCVDDMVDKNIVIVSGYANGVDLTAHTTALKKKGKTIFVLVEGLLNNRIKNDIRDLLDKENHLFISQFMPKYRWSASNAMKRNTTIIGNSDVMMMIESGMNGGTFAAGEQSLKSRKPLFVIEYGVTKPSAEGNPYFINHGAIPIRGNKNGEPILKRVYEEIDMKHNMKDERKDEFTQLSFELR